MGSNTEKHHHHIIPTKTALMIGGALLVLTVITVWIAGVDLGPLNFLVAMAVATLKASLVALFFMNLLYDRRENGVIFVASFLFLAIFVVLTATDLFFRGDVYVHGPLTAQSSTKSKLKKPWISTPELVTKGKDLYVAQCVSCHGATGEGNGPAASALVPHPRNFHEMGGWKNGRKPTMVFKTLKEGVPGSAMASFATLPPDDRWALTHYVLSLGGAPEADTAADFAKVGIDPTKEGGGATEAPTIPVDVAMEIMEVPSEAWEAHAKTFHPALEKMAEDSEKLSTGARIYEQNCLQCHGAEGQGMRVGRLGVMTAGAYVTSAPFTSRTKSLSSQAEFNQTVIQGLPGNIMPGFGNLSSIELQELYKHVQSLAK